MRRQPTAPVKVVRINVATSGTDFTAPEADFAAPSRLLASVLEDHICHVGVVGVRAKRTSVSREPRSENDPDRAKTRHFGTTIPGLFQQLKGFWLSTHNTQDPKCRYSH
jgi:hypothetical protein